MATYKVIDVSDWQDKIDWEKVKADGVVGAIIRYADGTTLDKRFSENMKNAKAAGIHVGCYIFSRAKTKAQAEKEAQRLFLAADKYKPDMPLYIDLEAKGLEKTADAVAAAFLNKMEELGGRGGVYANLHWWNNYLKKTAKNFSASPFWIAQYNKTMDYKPASVMGMWRYSSSGKVSGISGRVDMDKCYIAYWEGNISKKTINQLAWEVLDNVWGSGDERKKRIIEAGYDYEAVQARVNELVPIVEKVAEEVITGDKWGNGDERKKRITEAGYNYDVIQKKVNELLAPKVETPQDKICVEAKSIADSKKYKYKNFSEKYGKECAICHPHDGENPGWNCIGYPIHCWHVVTKCKCSCQVMTDQLYEKLLKVSAPEALKIVKERTGLKDIKVIIDKNGIPTSKLKKGDIIAYFNGNDYKHTALYLGDGKIADCTSGRKQSIKYGVNSYSKWKIKEAIRYMGK